MDSKLSGISDILRSLGDFVDGLTEETGGEHGWSAGGEAADERTGAKAVYGVSVRVGRGGNTRFERFGTVRPPTARAAAAATEDVREPIIDVFDEGDSLRLVAELPGVEAEDVHCELSGTVLSLKAHRGGRRYTKDVVLPVAVHPPVGRGSLRNGIFEIALPKAVAPAGR